MKIDNMFFYLLLIVIMLCTVANTLNVKTQCNVEPELVVFQVCIERAEEFNDVSICDCATFVGHQDWCNGDIKY